MQFYWSTQLLTDGEANLTIREMEEENLFGSFDLMNNIVAGL